MLEKIIFYLKQYKLDRLKKITYKDVIICSLVKKTLIKLINLHNIELNNYIFRRITFLDEILYGELDS